MLGTEATEVGCSQYYSVPCTVQCASMKDKNVKNIGSSGVSCIKCSYALGHDLTLLDTVIKSGAVAI